MEIKQIATISTAFKEKFGIPRQSNLVKGLKGVITFLPEYRTMDALRGIEGYSYIWLIWEFSEAKRRNDSWAATVTPPRLGGKERMGVFATRAPFRPNPIGLSSVKLEKVVYDEKKGPMLYVSGIDMLDGTPIYDIKPYLPKVDSHPKAKEGFTERTKEHRLRVIFPDNMIQLIKEEERENVVNILLEDPRTAFIHDEGRVWGVYYDIYNIRFTVCGDILTVIEVQNLMD